MAEGKIQRTRGPAFLSGRSNFYFLEFGKGKGKVGVRGPQERCQKGKWPPSEPQTLGFLEQWMHQRAKAPAGMTGGVWRQGWLGAVTQETSPQERAPVGWKKASASPQRMGRDGWQEGKVAELQPPTGWTEPEDHGQGWPRFCRSHNTHYSGF